MQIKVQEKPLEDIIPKAINQHSNDKDYIANKTMESGLEDDNLKGYYHIFEPQCFKNAFGKTMVEFFNLTDPIAAKDANEVVDYYYHHTLNNPSH